MVVSIHQPNFFPWLGYFDKIARSDIFIFLDDVQLQKTGGTWSNRVKMLIANEARWVTATINRNYEGIWNINETHFSDREQWRNKMLKSIETNYRKHPFYEETMKVIEPLVMCHESNIAQYNSNVVLTIVKKMGIDTGKFLWSSALPKSGSSNELLATLTLACNANTYMCGGGADDYQDEDVFRKFGVELMFQNFKHPVYDQVNTSEFVPNLSVIDALMNLGFIGVATLLQIRVNAEI